MTFVSGYCCGKTLLINVLFPEPATPVITVRQFLGMSTSIFFRLNKWAFLIEIHSQRMRGVFLYTFGLLKNWPVKPDEFFNSSKVPW
ncbi:hypothetical protein D3C71_1148370 [compost metagenome]